MAKTSSARILVGACNYRAGRSSVGSIFSSAEIASSNKARKVHGVRKPNLLPPITIVATGLSHQRGSKARYQRSSFKCSNTCIRRYHPFSSTIPGDQPLHDWQTRNKKHIAAASSILEVRNTAIQTQLKLWISNSTVSASVTIIIPLRSFKTLEPSKQFSQSVCILGEWGVWSTRTMS